MEPLVALDVHRSLGGGRDCPAIPARPTSRDVQARSRASKPEIAWNGDWLENRTAWAGRDTRNRVGGNDPGFGRIGLTALSPKPVRRHNSGDSGSFPPTHCLLPDDLPKGRAMKSYITKQPKYARERIEAKLDERLARKLEKYCQYLESDRDYVVSQALEIAFRKDKGFAEWLGRSGG